MTERHIPIRESDYPDEPPPPNYPFAVTLCVTCALIAASLVVVAVLVIALVTTTARAAPADHVIISANTMVPNCVAFLTDSPRRVGDQGVCGGIFITMVMLDDDLRICMPDTVTVGQAMRVAVVYIRARPARMHENFVTLALEALRDAWPCKGGNR